MKSTCSLTFYGRNMKALRKIWMLVAALAITAIGIGCRNTVKVEKDKTYASAVTFKADDAGGARVKITMETATEGASIFYTTDGKDPSAESGNYAAPCGCSAHLHQAHLYFCIP